jgi:hypothetical protein
MWTVQIIKLPLYIFLNFHKLPVLRPQILSYLLLFSLHKMHVINTERQGWLLLSICTLNLQDNYILINYGTLDQH